MATTSSCYCSGSIYADGGCERCRLGEGICNHCAGEGKDPDAGKVNVRFDFLREQLIHDIEHAAYTQHHVSKNSEGAAESVHLIAEIAEKGPRDRLARILALAFDTLCEALSPLTRRKLDDTSRTITITDTVWWPDIYRMLLRVSPQMSETTLHAIHKYCHDYMVNRSLYDWLLIVSPDVADPWGQRALEDLTELEKLKNMVNATNLRIRSHPF